MRSIMFRRYMLIFILVSGLVICWSSVSSAQKLMIADFNRGKKPNLIGGDFGAWDKNELDRSQYCVESFTANPKIVYGSRGCSLRIDYDVDSANTPAYNGFWMKLEKIDLVPYNYLTFYVKGDKKRGFSTDFSLIVKNTEKQKASFMVRGVDENWQKILIPLDAMKKDGNFTETTELLIVFDENVVTKKVGTIYIDNITLE